MRAWSRSSSSGALIARLRPAALVGTTDGVRVAQRVALLDLAHEHAEQASARLVDQGDRIPLVFVHDPQQRRDVRPGLEDQVVRGADGEEVRAPEDVRRAREHGQALATRRLGLEERCTRATSSENCGSAASVWRIRASFTRSSKAMR
jgi:hypothetical protein